MSAIVLDTETTGIDTGVDRVCELAIKWWNTGDEFCQRFSHDKPIPPHVTEINGIRDEDLVGKPQFGEFAVAVKTWIDGADAVIGQNPNFDREILNSEFKRAGLTPPRWPTMVDTKRIWNVYEPPEKRHLMNAYKRFVDKNGFDGAHSALADVRAAMRVLEKQMEEFDLIGKDWKELDPDSQKQWGPTFHVIFDDDGHLVANFGKNKGVLIASIDHSYWRWLSGQDFPVHVLMLGFQMTRIIEQRLSDEVAKTAILTWAMAYQQENFR